MSYYKAMTITHRSTYEQCVAEIDESAEEVVNDQAGLGASPDEIWADLASSLLIDAKPDVAREVCRCQLGYTPQTLENLWAQQEAAAKALAKKKAQAAAAKKKEDRRLAEIAQRHAERDAVRAARCAGCGTVPAANGACFC